MASIGKTFIICIMATKKTPVKKALAVVQDGKPKRDPFYTNPESMGEFCAYICQGGHMAGFCKERGLAYQTLSDWIYKDSDRAGMYARSREERADALADEIVSISDEQEVKANYNGEEVTLALDATAVARNRLRVDARKWAAAKLKPRVYGDKVTQEHTGAGGGAIQLTAVNLKGLSDAELEQMKILMDKAATTGS